MADGPQMTEAKPSSSVRAAERTIQAAAPQSESAGSRRSRRSAYAGAVRLRLRTRRPDRSRRPPSRPLKRRRIASPSPRSRLRRRPRPLPNRLLRQLRIYPSVWPASEAEPPAPAAPQQEATPTASPSSPELAKPPDAPREKPTRASLMATPLLTVAKTPEAETTKPKPAPPPKTQAAHLEGRKTEAENKRVVRTKSAKVDDRPEADHTRAPAGLAAPAARAAASPNSSSGASLERRTFI